jgi:protein-disulfide isomerase
MTCSGLWRRVVLGAVLIGLATGIRPAAAQGVTPTQADAILSELKEIRRLLEQMQKQIQAPGGAPRAAAPAPDLPVRVAIGDGQVLGSATAPLVLVEFTDYQCPYCRTFTVGTFPALKAKYIDTGRLAFVSRDLPLDFHPNALPAAHAALCAADQGKYWNMRPYLFANASTLQQKALVDQARDLSLDVAAFERCLSAKPHAATLQKVVQDAQAAGVEGTPTFILGRRVPGGIVEGVRIVGALPVEAFDAKIAQFQARK